MAKTKISEFSATPGNNTDIDGINLAEGCAPSGINDAIRELMAQLKDWQSGTSGDSFTIGSPGTLTYSSGTANGVAYLNGSKVLTTGSALQFDGSNLGLGVTPSAWNASIKVLEMPDSGFLAFANTNGNISTNAFFDTGYKYKATAAAARYSQSAGQHLWYTAPSGTAGNAISFTQAMTLDASGNLGIGTSSPGARLDVSGEALIQGRLQITSATPDLLFSVPSGGLDSRIHNDGNGNLIFGTGTNSSTPTERARIDSGGNFRVRNPTGGATSNGFLVEEDGTNTSRVSIGGANSSAATGLSLYSTTAGAFRFFVSYSGQINATSTSITAISDQSLKQNIRDLDTGLSEVMALKPRRFDWKAETQLDQKNVAGFIAQEVEQVLPELVYDYQYNETETKKSLKMGDILPTLVKAIQEQQAIIEGLKARIETLENK